MKAFVYYDSYAHLQWHERIDCRKIVKKRLFKAETKDKLFHIIYGRNCSESYCYPRNNFRFVSKSLTNEFKQWENDGGIALFAKYNRMD